MRTIAVARHGCHTPFLDPRNVSECVDGCTTTRWCGSPRRPLRRMCTSCRACRGRLPLYRRKHFGSLTPVWTRLCIYGVDTAHPEGPRIVHGFLPRDTAGYHIEETWDTLGMSATRSDDTVLEGAFVPDKYIVRIRPPGFVGADAFILAMFAWAEPLFANIYIGLAERARDLAIARVKQKTSVVGMTRSMAYHPEVQHRIAEIVLAIEGMIPHVERIAADWSQGVNHGDQWAAKLVAVKYHCVESAFRAVDIAMDVSGGRGMFKTDELERLYRDVRCGRFHPANAMVVHEVIGRSALGIPVRRGYAGANHLHGYAHTVILNRWCWQMIRFAQFWHTLGCHSHVLVIPARAVG